MKKLLLILPLVFLLCFTFGCQDKEAMAELEEFKAQKELEEQNKEIVRKCLRAIDEGNLEGALELFAPNSLWYSSSNNPSPMSKKESREFLVMLLKAFPEWIHKIEEIMPEADKVITRTIDITTQTGEFQGIPATGKKVEFGVIAIWRLEDGKIVEIREEGDMLGLTRQLGMELKPKEEK